MSGGPYRVSGMAVSAPEAAPPWWQRVVFRLWPDTACRSWEWARRRAGGRWALVMTWVPRIFGPGFWWVPEWQRVSSCPLEWHYFTDSELAQMSSITRLDAVAQNRTIDMHRPECSCQGAIDETMWMELVGCSRGRWRP